MASSLGSGGFELQPFIDLQQEGRPVLSNDKDDASSVDSIGTPNIDAELMASAAAVRSPYRTESPPSRSLQKTMGAFHLFGCALYVVRRISHHLPNQLNLMLCCRSLAGQRVRPPDPHTPHPPAVLTPAQRSGARTAMQPRGHESA